MRYVRSVLTFFVCLLLPRALKPSLLNLLGHRVARSARIAPCFIKRTRLVMGSNTSIGPLNLITCRRLVMRKGANIGLMNRMTGHYNVMMDDNAAIGGRNSITNGHGEGVWRPAILALGEWSKITVRHKVDVTESIIFGAFCTLAGEASQMWTHGFVHMETGLDREEVRGPIHIGHNVYIGSMSCFGPGISVADSVAIGAHSSVAKDLMEAGVYVSQGLRHVKSTPQERLAGLTRVGSIQGKGFYYRGRKGLSKVLASEARARQKRT